MNFDELNINFLKMVSKLRRPLDYAIIKFTSSALDINLRVLHNDGDVTICSTAAQLAF